MRSYCAAIIGRPSASRPVAPNVYATIEEIDCVSAALDSIANE